MESTRKETFPPAFVCASYIAPIDLYSKRIMSFHDLVENQRAFFMTGQPATLAYRKNQLTKLRKVLYEEQDSLAEAVFKDLRRDKELTKVIELAAVFIEIDYMLDNMQEWSSPTDSKRRSAGDWSMELSLNVLLLPLVAVLAAGNTAIVKPSEVASHTAQVVDLILSKAFDKQYIAVVQGGVEETTQLLKEKFDHIMFTGSPPLGGKCPVIVEADADIEVTARRLVWGKFLNCGQTCLSPDYVLVNSAVKNQLVDAVILNLRNFYGKEVQSSPDYSRIINQRHFDRILDLLEKTKDEIFGPILPIMSVGNLSEAIDVVRRGERPLALYLFTRDESKVQRTLQETISGSVCINDVVIQVTVDTLPFGGVGNSGMGRYRGKFGFDEFTHERSVLKRGFFGDSMFGARYPPLNRKKLGQLHQLTSTRRAIPKWLKSSLQSLPCVMIGMALGLENAVHLTGRLKYFEYYAVPVFYLRMDSNITDNTLQDFSEKSSFGETDLFLQPFWLFLCNNYGHILKSPLCLHISGFMLHRGRLHKNAKIQKDHKVTWPLIKESLKLQLYNQLVLIYPMALAQLVWVPDAELPKLAPTVFEVN
uniref:Aldehyde dehydrogenase domain-containing protein n=1 Tax=Ditylenchus dipsaci TaxID=166011 RepID=A0A915D5L8_9BILA